MVNTNYHLQLFLYLRIFEHFYFTGVSIATVLFGDIGIYFDPDAKISSGITYLSRGNAAFTRHYNTTISALLVFNVTNQQQHCLFINPFACNPLSNDYFPIWKTFNLKPYEIGNNLEKLSVMFFPRKFNKFLSQEFPVRKVE
ncbi:MAG: hypothetical protein ABSA09_07755 [Desulfobaccales bacterium]